MKAGYYYALRCCAHVQQIMHESRLLRSTQVCTCAADNE